jgi:hypothetical protein
MAETAEGESRQQAFLLTRHYIGRLGSHLRAAKLLVAAGLKLPELFDGFTIQRRPSPKPATLPPPTDHLTTLEGILRRMLPKGSVELATYEEALTTMDAMFNIRERLFALYQDKDFRPRVHAELILLEYFYREQLEFVDDDRFIGCSKPACYCCYHYISQHPGGFVRPLSHGIRYLNWLPPEPNIANREEKTHRRDVLNKVIAQIRLDTLRQIVRRRGPSPWRPDSTTGITQSAKHSRSGYERDSDQAGDTDTSHSDTASYPSFAGSSSHIFTSQEGKEALAGDAGSPLEQQDVIDSDSGSDGGVSLF